MSESGSSIAGSVAEDDGLDDDDGFEPRDVAQEAPSISNARQIQDSTVVVEEKLVIEDDYSNITPQEQPDDSYAAKAGPGSSEKNPIELDNEIRACSEVIDESSDDRSEVVSYLQKRDKSSANVHDVDMPYGYTLQAPIADEPPNNLTPDVDYNVADTDVVQDSNIGMPSFGDNEGLEYMNPGNILHTTEIRGYGSDRNGVHRPSPGLRQVCKSTYEEIDEEDDESSIAETEDEAVRSSRAASSNVSNASEARKSDLASSTYRMNSHPALLVGNSQCVSRGTPRASTGSILDVSSKSFFNDPVVHDLPSISERPPSPSDAAMKDSQYFPNPIKQHIYGSSVPTALLNAYPDSKQRSVTKTNFPTPEVWHAHGPAPSVGAKSSDGFGVDYGISNGLDATWETHLTHYNDGPFAQPVARPLAHPDVVPAPLTQAAACNLQVYGAEASDPPYLEIPGTKPHDSYHLERQAMQPKLISFQKHETQRLHGRRKLPNIQTSVRKFAHDISSPVLKATREPRNQQKSTLSMTTGGSELARDDSIETTKGSQSPAKVIGTKRKADNMLSDSDNTSEPHFSHFSQPSEAEVNHEITSLPDAQPRDTTDFAPQSDPSQTTDLSLEPTISTAPMPSHEEPPRKRVKTIAKWIGTTILFGVGVCYTIGATAPQSVWDEVEREMGLR